MLRQPEIGNYQIASRVGFPPWTSGLNEIANNYK